jgi:hypothetical protein
MTFEMILDNTNKKKDNNAVDEGIINERKSVIKIMRHSS